MGTPVIGGTATISRQAGISVSTKVGAGNGGIIVEPYKTQAELAALEANLNKSVYIQDSVYGNMQLKGTIKSMQINRIIGQVTYDIEETSRKLLKIRTGNSVNLLSTFVHRVDDEVIYNIDGGWSVNAYVGNVLSFVDADFYGKHLHCMALSYELYNSAGEWVTLTADVVAGDIDSIWYEDDGNPTAFGLFTANVAGNENAIRIITEFKDWSKDGLTWNEVYLNIKVRFTALKGSKVLIYPTIEVYNDDTSTWTTLYSFTQANLSSEDLEDEEEWANATIEAADNDGGKSPIASLRIDVLAGLGITAATFKASYMSLWSSENDSGFASSRVKVRVTSNYQGTVITSPEPKIELHYIDLEFQQKKLTAPTSQAMEVGTFTITSNTAQTITLSTGGVTAAPQGDGCSMNDGFVVTSDLITQIGQVIGSTSFTYSDQITADLTSFHEANDILNMKCAAWFDKISGIHNMYWLYNPTPTTDPIEFWDTVPASGVTLTMADELWDLPVKVHLDVINIRDVIFVYGFQNIFSFDTPTPEYSNTLGSEHEIYTDNTLISKKQVDQMATKKGLLHTDAQRMIEFPISLDNPSQDYSGLVKGKSVIVSGGADGTVDILPSDDGVTTGRILFIHETVYQHLPPDRREILILILSTRKMS